jgi:hypothetical protein
MSVVKYHITLAAVVHNADGSVKEDLGIISEIKKESLTHIAGSSNTMEINCGQEPIDTLENETPEELI